MDISPNQKSDYLSSKRELAGKENAGLGQHHSAILKLVQAKLNGQGSSAVDDIVQEVALVAKDADHEKIEGSGFGAWLRQVAIHKVQDYWRRESRQRKIRHRLNSTPDGEFTPIPSPYEWVMRLESAELVTDALDSLTEEDREVLAAKYLHGQSYAEISDELGITSKTLEYRLSRARNAMRSILNLQEPQNISKP